jgi:hypothetical protein
MTEYVNNMLAHVHSNYFKRQWQIAQTEKVKVNIPVGMETLLLQ